MRHAPRQEIEVHSLLTMTHETNIDAIKQWRSILTLVVFVLISELT
jgi:hypothetical protein